MGKMDKDEAKEIEAVPGFFGHAVRPGCKLLWTNETDDLAMQLNTAALGVEVVVGRSTLLVTAKEHTIALCTLQPQCAEQWNLNHVFTSLDGPVEFSNQGVNVIHLSGMIDLQEEEDGCGGHCDEDSEDDDENPISAMFGVDSDDEEVEDEDDDEEEEEEEEIEIEDPDSDRFEVLEERMHGEEDADKPAEPKGKSPVKEQAAQKTMPSKKDKKETSTKKTDASPAKKEDAASSQKQKPASTEKETKATSGKKRVAADQDSNTDTPKKTKTVREYKGVKIEEHAVGKGQPVQRGKKVAILYRGCLTSGKQFDANQNRKKPFSFRHGLGDVIKGMDIGIEGMRPGGKRTITIPPHLGYGRQGAPPQIPRNATLVFDIELL